MMLTRFHPWRLPLVTGLLLVSLPLYAARGELQYTVMPRDTLIGIGERLLARPANWPQIQTLNAVTDPYRLQPGSVLRIPLSLLKPEPLQARVDTLAGEVRIDGQPASSGSLLQVGQLITTAADGYAVLVLPDNSRLVLKPDSRLRLETLQRDRVRGLQASRLDLQQGRLDNAVQPQKGPTARYEIRTPTAVIGVRGTEFRTAVAAGEARVEVTTGAVQARAAKASLRVAAGQGALLPQGGAVQGLALPPAPSLAAVPNLFERPLIRLALPASPARLIVSPAGADPLVPPVFEQVESGREARIPGLPDGDYRLSVRSIDARGLEGLDASTGFRLKARPEPPFPTQPRADGKQRGTAAELAWTSQAGIARYRLEIAATADFAQPVVRQDAIDATRLAVPLPSGDYFWRLGSIRPDGDRGPWGDAQRFSLKPPQAAPEPPALDDKGLNFAWPGEAGQRFEFEMASDAAFNHIVTRQETLEPRLSLPVPGSGSYFVRVKAIDADGFVGEWSSTQQFEVPRDWTWLWLLTPLLLLL